MKETSSGALRSRFLVLTAIALVMLAGCAKKCRVAYLEFHGTLLDPLHRPVPDAEVTVLAPSDSACPGAESMPEPSQRSRTDLHGSFAFETSDHYRVWFSYPTWAVLAGTIYGSFVVAMIVVTPVGIVLNRLGYASVTRRLGGIPESILTFDYDGVPYLWCLVELPCMAPRSGRAVVGVTLPDGTVTPVGVEVRETFTNRRKPRLVTYDLGEVVLPE